MVEGVKGEVGKGVKEEVGEGGRRGWREIWRVEEEVEKDEVK